MVPTSRCSLTSPGHTSWIATFVMRPSPVVSEDDAVRGSCTSLGVTTSSKRVRMFVYEIPANVSCRLLSASMNFDVEACWRLATGHPIVEQVGSAFRTVVPWLLPAKPIASSTIVRVSGQNRSAQRNTMPPWLWPMSEMRRPARRCTSRIAEVTYSPAVCTSARERSGSSIEQNGTPTFRSAGFQFQS
ncbi:unannotated protein [freshwater metagenome]|uniref:Unannotated protein n=1 Tax=freshwater metagenome TaxID=449393 RepID=A0A6J7H3K5_9ZZZZ